MSTQDRPQVGIGLLVLRENRVLLGKRRTAHGKAEYAGPGGHLEHLESFQGAALRELAEEAGDNLQIKNLEILTISNMTRYAPKHFVVVSFRAEWVSGEPCVMEPDKLDSWGWYDFDNLPHPLYGATADDVMAFQTGRVHFDDAIIK